MTTVVLFVSRQPTFRTALTRALQRLGHRVEVASGKNVARQLLQKERVAAAVVAPTSPRPREIAFVREVQDAVGKLVVLAPNARTAKQFAATCPEALVSPSPECETEKVIAFLHPPEAPAVSDFFYFADCTLDVQGRILRGPHGREAPLTRGEFAILLALVRNPGRALSRAQMRRAIDGRSARPHDRSIDMLVARVRRKIALPTERFIVTVPGVGYKFVPPVRTTSQSTPEQSPWDQPRIPHGVRRAERRQLTVLACQLIGFARLADELDPEDLEKIIGKIYTSYAEVITRFGGTVVHAIGDQVLAFFGHPRVRENDAERAVRAALELLRLIGRTETVLIGRFRPRIGIATGLVVVGDCSIGSGKETTTVGKAINLAMHMQNAAPSESVVLATSTRDLLGHFFDCVEFGPVAVEEGLQPVPAWRVMGGMANLPRFEALRRDGMSNLVGRRAELERLLQCWSVVCRGTGQVVLLRGEAGIGKSRLVIELQDRIASTSSDVLRYFGSPYGADAPMAALLDELQCSAGCAPEDAAPRKIEKLHRHFLSLGLAAEQATALVAPLLELSLQEPAEISQPSPQKRKERTFAMLLARIQAAASRRPTLVVVEDVHWLDPTSLEFLMQVVERVTKLNILLVIAGRPEFTPPWPDYPHITKVTLARLARPDSATLINQLAGEDGIPATLETEIIARAEGVPLFLEELTKSTLERRRGQTARKPDESPTIPSTLQSLLLDRFDQLKRGREIAQAAAVIGHEFSFKLLHLTLRADKAMLVDALDQLVNAGLVLRRGSIPLATFAFKHALMRDAVYDTLLRKQRQSLHAGVAQTCEEHFPEIAVTQPELLGHHYRVAGDSIKAVTYYLQAAERAVRRSFASEALTFLKQARQLLSAMPDDKERWRLELTLEIILGRTLIARYGYTALQTRETYWRARALCTALGDETLLPQIIHAQWVSEWSASNFGAALKIARELSLYGERNKEPAGSAVALVNFGMTWTMVGNLVEARRCLEQALQINQFTLSVHRPFMFSDSEPGRISALMYLHYCLLLLGFPDQAKGAAREAMALMPRQVYTQGLVEIYFLRMHILERDAANAAEKAATLLRLTEELGYPYLLGASMTHMGWALAQGGDPAAGIDLCRRGLAQLRAINVKCWLPFYLTLLGECLGRAGDIDAALCAVAEARQAVEGSGEHFWEAEICRLKGKLLLRGNGDTDAAHECFVEALHKARRQRAKLLELRAAMSIAELQRSFKPIQARKALVRVYSSFTEGYDFSDVREAKALIDNLSAASGHHSKEAPFAAQM